MKKYSYDVEFQSKTMDISFRVNDNIAYTEEEAIKLAEKKFEEQTGISLSQFGFYYIDIPYGAEAPEEDVQCV